MFKLSLFQCHIKIMFRKRFHILSHCRIVQIYIEAVMCSEISTDSCVFMFIDNYGRCIPTDRNQICEGQNQSILKIRFYVNVQILADEGLSYHIDWFISITLRAIRKCQQVKLSRINQWEAPQQTNAFEVSLLCLVLFRVCSIN